MKGVDKFQEKEQEAPENIGVRTEEPAQPMEDGQAEEKAGCTPEVENIRRKVKEAMRKAEEKEIMERKAEKAKCEAWEARLAPFKAKAEEAKSKAEAAEREVEAARVVMLEAVTEREKAAAGEVSREACDAASWARFAVEAAERAAPKKFIIR
jgi:hypothetical protein